ncbi:MAG: N-acetyltransferase, partial [Alphaproteobacteria bacterium]
MKLSGWRAIERVEEDFYRCPRCQHLQETIGYGEDRLATCYGCKREVPIEDFGTGKVNRSVAICAECGERHYLLSLNQSSSGQHYVCECSNIVAVHYGRRLVRPDTILRLDWSPPLIARGEGLGVFRWAGCSTKKDNLVARMLWRQAKEEEGSFIYGDDAKRRTMVFFNDSGFLGYLFWSEVRDGTGKKEPVLRQLFVKKEFRRQGIGAAAVKLWAERFAFPLASQFGVEAPSQDTIRILVKLGYLHRDDKNKLVPAG